MRLEKLLQSSEEIYAESLRRIRSAGQSLSKTDEAVLRHFIYLQHCRTEATLQRAASFLAEMADAAEISADQRMNMKQTVLMGMNTFAETMTIVNDLKVCLIRNKTSRQFITSDNPSVMTNRWYIKDPRANGYAAGAGNSGVLLFLPITPFIFCVVYDGDVYSITNSSGWAVIDKITDVDAFNEHQFLACSANVYFADWTARAEIRRHWDIVKPRRPAVRHQLVTAVLDHEDDWGKSYRVVAQSELPKDRETLIHVKSIQPSPSRWPSIIKWRSNPRIYSNGSRTGFVRRARAEQMVFSAMPYRRI